MNNSRIWGIVLLIGYCIFLFKDDIRSFIRIPGIQISPEVRELVDKIKPLITPENKSAILNIGNMFIHESELFRMQQGRYSNDSELKDKFHESLVVSAGYPYGIDISQYPELSKFLKEYAVSSIGEEGFSNEKIVLEFKKIGSALKYAAE